MTESGQGAMPREQESPLWAAVLLAATVVMIAVGVVMTAHGVMDQWIKLLGVLGTLGLFTVLYKENPIFRFFEHIFIGLAAGFGLVLTWQQVLFVKWYQPMMSAKLIEGGGGQWWLIFAFLLALLFYTVYFPKLAWMNRFLIGLTFGWAAGYAFQEFVSVVGPQVSTSFKAPVTIYPPATTPTGLGWLDNIHLGPIWLHPYALVFIIVLLCAMAYFFFSVEHRTRWIRTPANAGRYFIMITLGAIFGTTVMGRLSLIIQRLDFLLNAFSGWWHMIFK
jgi:hypothetical protein